MKTKKRQWVFFKKKNFLMDSKEVRFRAGDKRVNSLCIDGRSDWAE